MMFSNFESQHCACSTAAITDLAQRTRCDMASNSDGDEQC